MTGSQQAGKEVNFVFVKGLRRSRVASEDSDDSDMSGQSGKGGEGSSSGSAKKKLNTGDEKMDEEEKRKNFLERNRQGTVPIVSFGPHACLFMTSSVINVYMMSLLPSPSCPQVSTTQEAMAGESSGKGGVLDNG